MSTTLNNIAPDLYRAVESVSRELTGLSASVTVNTGAKARVAVGEDIVSFRTQKRSSSAIVPGHVPNDNPSGEVFTPTVRVNNAKKIPIVYTDEQVLRANQAGGHGFRAVLMNEMQQAFRVMANEIEASLSGSFKNSAAAGSPANDYRWQGASRATSATSGSALTVPFGDSGGMEDFANATLHLNLNGAPMMDRCMVMGHAAAANVRANTHFTQVNTSGSTGLLRGHELPILGGFKLEESYAIDSELKHAAIGTLDSGAKVNAATSAGATTIAIKDGGNAKTVVAGDIAVIDGYNYLIREVSTTAAAGTGSINIMAPGLVRDCPANATVKLVAIHQKSAFALHKGAAELIIRAPAREEGGDSASEVMLVKDTRSIMSFEVSRYREYRQQRWEVAAVWGHRIWQPEHVILVAG